MDEANRNDSFNCRESRPTRKLHVDDAKGLGFRRTAYGLLLLMMMAMMLAMSLTNGVAVLRQTVSNAVGDRGIDRQELNAQKLRDNTGVTHSSGTAGQSSEQLRHRGKREERSENGDAPPSKGSATNSSLPIHSESTPTALTDLEKLKRRLNDATSECEMLAIIESSLLKNPDHSCSLQVKKASSSNLKRKFKQRSRSNSSTVAPPSHRESMETSLNPQEVMAIQANMTCGLKPVKIIGQFGLGRNEGETIQLRICGPKETPSSTSNNDTPQEKLANKLKKRAQKQAKWIKYIKGNSLCRPMEMILNLEPVQKPSPHPVSALIKVTRCRPLYVAQDETEENVTCVAERKRTRLVSIKYNRVVKTYMVTDHLECSATKNRSALTTKQTKKSCPWPFHGVNQTTRCTCRKVAKTGSRSYLRYQMCRNIQRGVSKLENKEAWCVYKRRCLPPICDDNKIYNKRRRQCWPARTKRIPTTKRRT